MGKNEFLEVASCRSSGLGIIYDLDGTLLDSLQDLGETANEVLLELNLPLLPMFVYRDLVGNGIAELCRRAIALAILVEKQTCFNAEQTAFLPGVLELVRTQSQRPKLDQKTEDISVASFYSRYQTNWQRNTRPFPQVNELLEQLAAAGFSQALISNKADAFVKEIVDQYFSPSLFDVVMGQLDHIPSKPSPVGPLLVAERWEIEPESILFIGDSDVDMHTAKAAGMIPVAVSWGFRDRDELIQAGGQHILESPLELIDLLRQIISHTM
ncbi:MAG: HAD family hydrolase [Fastidiosipilaceae bacterium]|nr:HAD family hydrolase [Clostridiaceae bacterium]